jgi:hypothetical protein
MAKAAARKPNQGTRGTGRFVKHADLKEPQFPTTGEARFAAVMKAAKNSGLLGEKSARIGGRVSPALVEQAKKQTGIEADTALIEFALASVALEDDFAKTFRKTRGTVDPTLKLGF